MNINPTALHSAWNLYYLSHRGLTYSLSLYVPEWWTPACGLVGLDGLEPSTSRLSGVRSNHLSYKPLFNHSFGIGSSILPLSLLSLCEEWIVKSEEVNLLRFAVKIWWRWWGSNPWPPACRAGALPAELHPRFRVSVLKDHEMISKNWTTKVPYSTA